MLANFRQILQHNWHYSLISEWLFFSFFVICVAQAPYKVILLKISVLVDFATPRIIGDNSKFDLIPEHAILEELLSD